MKYFSCENATIRHSGVKFTTYSTLGSVKGVAAVSDENLIKALLSDKKVVEIEKEKYEQLLGSATPPKPTVRHVSPMFTPASRAADGAQAPVTESGEPTVGEVIVQSVEASKVGKVRKKGASQLP